MRNCFLIPIYNHASTIAAMVEALLPYQLPIIIVDDGSDQQTKQVLQELAQSSALVTVHTLPYNQGKGAAVSAGLQQAHQQGFSHALQLDADGQHDVDDLPKFWQMAVQAPTALISGKPLYDSSMPASRRIGRQITHFWVRIETWSGQVEDTMLGYRVYPVAACIQLLQQRLGQRMDFDTEIMVRLYWQGVPLRFIPTKVTYPEDGSSHFALFRDNWLITKMHTRLFFGMLRRLPQLLRQARSQRGLV